MIPSGFHRYPERQPCPVCGHKSWCRLISDDGTKAICQRTPSEKRWGDAGWLHKLDQPVIGKPRHRIIEQPLRAIDAPEILREFMLDTTTKRLAEFADNIGVSRESLRRLGAVWAERYDAWAFPMRTAAGISVGIRLRKLDGAKFAVKGSNDGLFIPSEMSGTGPLLICEGPTDTAAILDLGFDAIGRPSCNSGTKHILEYLKQNKRDVVIAANYDEAKHRPDGAAFYPGQQGAESLADLIFKPTRIIYPLRAKDFRAWVNVGATHGAIESMIANTRYFRRKQAG